MSVRTRLRTNRVVSFVVTMPQWDGLPRWILITLGVHFAFHLLLFALNGNWWNDPAFLPTSPAGGR